MNFIDLKLYARHILCHIAIWIQVSTILHMSKNVDDFTIC